jgi:hypothetical protein
LRLAKIVEEGSEPFGLKPSVLKQNVGVKRDVQASASFRKLAAGGSVAANVWLFTTCRSAAQPSAGMSAASNCQVAWSHLRWQAARSAALREMAC